MTPPEHLNFFTLQGMRTLFRKAELREISRSTFGTLTKSQTERVVSKYFPEAVRPLERMIRPMIPFGVRVMNFLKIGMELEFYLVKGR